jgi:4-alpha-glucanotransferase
MWMHRIFCVPNGMEATEGVYVHYRPDELYGVLALESQRARTRVVGEDLGTVPHEVREAMDETAVRRMFVLQYEIRPEREPPVPSPPRAVVASLNTHDMPPFAAFWAEHDVEDRIAMGLLSEDEASGERHGREVLRDALRRLVRDRGEGAESPEQVLAGILSYLAASDAELLLVNLEDLWLETRPQNVPGTGPDERPNWRRRIAFRLEDVFAKPGVRDVLERIARERGRS